MIDIDEEFFLASKLLIDLNFDKNVLLICVRLPIGNFVCEIVYFFVPTYRQSDQFVWIY
jgi:hypothetical protein